MIRINLSRINWLQVGSYIVIAILTLLLFRNCEENKDLKLAKYSFEQEIKISQLQVDKYANQVNLLNDKMSAFAKILQRNETGICIKQAACVLP